MDGGDTEVLIGVNEREAMVSETSVVELNFIINYEIQPNN